MDKSSLQDTVLETVKRQIVACASLGGWRCRFEYLKKDHARVLRDDMGLKVHPDPDRHDYDEFTQYDVNWKDED